ncbi:MAG: hypothetical protein ACTHNP_01745 [Solirubrobacterales bacterium]
MRKKLLASVLVLAGLMLPARALAAGVLVSDFGNGGAVVTPVSLHEPWTKARVHVAEAPDGGILVASEGEVARYAADGQLDPSFGRGGFLTVALPSVASFAISDIAVDPEGRIVLTGTALVASGSGPASSMAAVVRYLPDGELDPSFGGGDGTFISRFGLPIADGGVVARQGAVSQWGEVTLVVGTIGRAGTCGTPQRRERDRLIARLSPEGTIEGFFGDGGVQRIAPLETVTGMAFGRGGAISLAGPAPRKCGEPAQTAVISLRPDGDRRRGFATGGVRRLSGAVAAIAVDPQGRTVMIFKERQKPAIDEHVTKLVRLLPNGDRDPSFGKNGLIVYEFQGPLYKWSSLLVTPTGRLLAVGTLIRPLPPKKRKDGVRFHRWFMAWPLQESGEQAGGFGWLGWLAITRFNPRSDAAASDALIGADGNLLIAGTAREPTLAPHGGFALARYELWH